MLDDATGPSATGDGVRDLWVGVLLQALSDAAMPAGGCSRSYPVEAVTGARRWLAGGSNPWTLALALSAADIDPDCWRSRALPALRARWRAADAGIGAGAAPWPTPGRGRPSGRDPDPGRCVRQPAGEIGAPGAA
jgi:hypothetical protein